MLDYLQPIGIALIIFSIIAVMIFVPWLIYIYRKLGYFPVSSTIIVFTFIFYFLAAFLLTMLPLPETRNNCAVSPAGRTFYSFVPFQFVKDLLRETNVVWSSPSTYIYLLKERAFFQAFFNLLLLMPLGVYLRYFFQVRKAWFKAMLIVFSVTLGYEITQVTGIYGIYECPYRLFDIDDLMLNITGGILGFFIAPIVLALFPTRAKVQEKAELILEKDEVRNMPVLIAALIDLLIIQLSSAIVAQLMNNTDIWSMLFIHLAMLIIFLVVIPITKHGYTIGSKFMRFRYSHPQLTKKLTKRMLAFFLIYAIQFVAQILYSVEADIDSSTYMITIVFTLLSWFISFMLIVILGIHALIVLWSKEKRKFFFDAYAELATTRRTVNDEEDHDMREEH